MKPYSKRQLDMLLQKNSNTTVRFTPITSNDEIVHGTIKLLRHCNIYGFRLLKSSDSDTLDNTSTVSVADIKKAITLCQNVTASKHMNLEIELAFYHGQHNTACNPGCCLDIDDNTASETEMQVVKNTADHSGIIYRTTGKVNTIIVKWECDTDFESLETLEKVAHAHELSIEYIFWLGLQEPNF